MRQKQIPPFPIPWKRVDGHLRLSGLESVNDFVFPKTVKHNLVLDELLTAENLQLPETIGGDLFLRRLESLDGLELKGEIGGSVYLRIKFREDVPENWNKKYKIVFI